jgi:hypothetical protein
MTDAKRLLQGLFACGLVGASLLTMASPAQAVNDPGKYYFEDSSLAKGVKNDLYVAIAGGAVDPRNGGGAKGALGSESCITITNQPTTTPIIYPKVAPDPIRESKASPWMIEYQGGVWTWDHKKLQYGICDQNQQKVVKDVNGPEHKTPYKDGFLVDLAKE